MKALTFDDVLLVPKYSDINSRSIINIMSSTMNAFNKVHPLIPSNIDSITEADMAYAAILNRAYGIIHRFMPIRDQVNMYLDVKKRIIAKTPLTSGYSKIGEANLIRRVDMQFLLGASIGVGEAAKERANKLINAGCRVICIDVAHGHHENVKNMIQYLRKYGIMIIAGNVATYEGVKFLHRAGAHMIKVGIGSGSICSTRDVAGVGVPQLTAIQEAQRYRNSKNFGLNNHNFKIISDGGIKTSGDIVKALAAGADFVMSGFLVAGSKECPGEVFIKNGKKYKVYRGAASKSAQVDNGKIPRDITVEGVTSSVPFRGTVHYVYNEITKGIASGFSYLGAYNIKELRQNAKFIEITSHGRYESKPNIIDQ